jgi:hypothetical protein
MSVSNKIATSPPVSGLDRVMWISLRTTQQETISQQVLPSAALSMAIRRARAFFILAKPEITLMVMISAGVSCLMASDSINLAVLAHTVLGTGLVAAGAASLNQFMERAAHVQASLACGKTHRNSGIRFWYFALGRGNDISDLLS